MLLRRDVHLFVVGFEGSMRAVSRKVDFAHRPIYLRGVDSQLLGTKTILLNVMLTRYLVVISFKAHRLGT